MVTLILVRATPQPEFLRTAPISDVLIFGFKNIVQVRHLVQTLKFPSKNKHLRHLVTKWLLDKIWSIGEGNGKPLQYFCLENAMNSMKGKMIVY